VGGGFGTAARVRASRIARWSGQEWTAFSGEVAHDVLALQVHDDGGWAGPALLAGDLCVVPPVERGGPRLAAGTNGSCHGSSQDLNARWTAKSKLNPGLGAVAYAQPWCRDPLGSSF
jgi:hypothetical protein